MRHIYHKVFPFERLKHLYHLKSQWHSGFEPMLDNCARYHPWIGKMFKGFSITVCLYNSEKYIPVLPISRRKSSLYVVKSPFLDGWTIELPLLAPQPIINHGIPMVNWDVRAKFNHLPTKSKSTSGDRGWLDWWQHHEICFSFILSLRSDTCNYSDIAPLLSHGHR